MNEFNTQIAHGRRSLPIAAALSAVLAFCGCGESSASAPQVQAAVAAARPAVRDVQMAPVPVAIQGFAFAPATLTVAAGTRVEWINRDEEPHLVVSASAQFPASPALDTDDHYSTVFTKPGVYTYFCSIHPHMVGKIIVK